MLSQSYLSRDCVFLYCWCQIVWPWFVLFLHNCPLSTCKVVSCTPEAKPGLVWVQYKVEPFLPSFTSLLCCTWEKQSVTWKESEIVLALVWESHEKYAWVTSETNAIIWLKLLKRIYSQANVVHLELRKSFRWYMYDLLSLILVIDLIVVLWESSMWHWKNFVQIAF